MRRLVLIALLLAAPVLRAAPEASPELAALVPQETLLLVEANDLDGAGRCGPATALGQLLAEPDVQFFVKKFEQSLQAAMAFARRPMAMVGVAPEDFEGIRVKRLGFALVGAAVDGPKVDAVLYLETRAGGDKVLKILTGLRQAAEMYVGVKFTESDVRGRKVLSALLEGHELCIAAKGEQLVVTSTRARMEDVLKALDEGHPQPLRTAPRISKLRDRMGAGRNAIFGYADVPALLTLGLDAFGREDAGHAAEAKRILGVLGIDAVEAAAFADIPEGTGYRTEGALLLKERRGIFGLAPGARTKGWTGAFAQFAPADALAYGEETCDLAALWDGILALAGAIGPEHRAVLEKGKAKADAMHGLDLRADLLAALGTEWAGYLAFPPGGGILPDIVIFASVRDRERLAKTLDALSAKANEFVREHGASVTLGRTEFRGKEIKFLEITDHRGDPRPYAPSWAFGTMGGEAQGDFVVIGLCPQSVKNALAEKPALVRRAEFQQLLSSAPRTSVSLGYVDLARVVSCLYATAVPALQVVQGAVNKKISPFGVRLNFEDLPPADVIARHLSGLSCYSTVEDDCVRVGCVSQFGAPLVVAPVVATAALAAAVMRWERVQAQHRAMSEVEAARAAEDAARREATARMAGEEARAKLEAALAENAMFRERLAKLEQQVEELKKAIGEKK